MISVSYNYNRSLKINVGQIHLFIVYPYSCTFLVYVAKRSKVSQLTGTSEGAPKGASVHHTINFVSHATNVNDMWMPYERKTAIFREKVRTSSPCTCETSVHGSCCMTTTPPPEGHKVCVAMV